MDSENVFDIPSGYNALIKQIVEFNKQKGNGKGADYAQDSP